MAKKVSEKQVVTSEEVGTLEVNEENSTKATPSKVPRLQAIYDELKAQKEPLAAERDKVRSRLDELTQSEEVNQLRSRMKEINKQLFPIDNELAALARALGPKASVQAEPGNYSSESGETK